MAHALSDVAQASRNGRWSDFWVRLGSAAILGPIALFCIWHGGRAWELFVGAGLIGLGFEWSRLAHAKQSALLPCLLLAVWVCEIRAGWQPGLMAVLVMTAIVFLSSGWFVAIGIPYAGIGGIALLWLRLQPSHGLADTMFLVVTIWGTDVGAYLVGRILGGPKLAPRISPGKTWSGAVGGLLIGGFAGAMLAGDAHGINFAALPAAFLLSIFAQGGDLLESAIKRKLGVKDSGRTIPGHGGLFDRLDGFLTAAPMAAILALSVHGGLPLWG